MSTPCDPLLTRRVELLENDKLLLGAYLRDYILSGDYCTLPDYAGANGCALSGRMHAVWGAHAERVRNAATADKFKHLLAELVDAEEYSHDLIAPSIAPRSSDQGWSDASKMVSLLATCDVAAAYVFPDAPRSGEEFRLRTLFKARTELVCADIKTSAR